MVGVYAKKPHFHRSPHFHCPCSLGPYRRVSDVWMLHFQLKGILGTLLIGNVLKRKLVLLFPEQIISNHLKLSNNFAEVENQ